MKLLSSCRGCEVCISALLLNFSLCIMKRSWSPVSAELADVMCPALSLRLPAIPDPVTVLCPLLNMFIMFAWKAFLPPAVGVFRLWLFEGSKDAFAGY